MAHLSRIRSWITPANIMAACIAIGVIGTVTIQVFIDPPTTVAEPGPHILCNVIFGCGGTGLIEAVTTLSLLLAGIIFTLYYARVTYV